MSAARFRVAFAGPLVTVQDVGRRGQKRFGVPCSGPMDRLACAAGRAVLDLPDTAAGIEISMGGLVLECTEGATTLAVTGGDFSVTLDGAALDSWNVLSIEAGQSLSIRPGASGSWAYLHFAGLFQADNWLGSVATHSASGFGGGAVVTGQGLTVEAARVDPAREGTFSPPVYPGAPNEARVVMGPQDRHFHADALATFQQENYALTDAYDRMGVRLAGSELALNGALSIPSEPVLRGSVQVAGDGVPTVLLADHQTTGGYPKIATVIGPDQDRLAQLRARDTVRFVSISPEEAVVAARQAAAQAGVYLDALRIPRGTFSERLLKTNLISGAVSAAEE
ncbi:biotin-dependent carboxyltransferase family protein [Aliiroseovarius marinus]|uniref:5-oxoprolinase subunit C family protein n=1 Tax=Aliiroseovarius marinus TaxID=2500159 RepID=UPI003D7C979D